MRNIHLTSFEYALHNMCIRLYKKLSKVNVCPFMLLSLRTSSFLKVFCNFFVYSEALEQISKQKFTC